jgi:biotin carboxyl carrier protein
MENCGPYHGDRPITAFPVRYFATIDGVGHEFEIEELAGGIHRLRLGGEDFQLDVRRVGPASFSILANNLSFDFHVAQDGDETVIAGRGGVTRLTIVDPRRAKLGASGGREITGHAEIKAMMPGRVVSVLVKQGDHIAAGQGLLVVEAMKMENEIKAPKGGVVAAVRVTAGVTVEKNDLLVIIE